MFKRTIWTAIGYGAGLGTSIYMQRKVKRTVEKYTPEHVRSQVARGSRNVAESARYVGRDVAAAVREGRQAMRQEETDLRDEFEPRRLPPQYRTRQRGSSS